MTCERVITRDECKLLDTAESKTKFTYIPTPPLQDFEYTDEVPT